MKIGLFFGSFNPIHVGHLIIADYFCKYSDLDEVWMLPSPHNPLKKKTSLLAYHQRIEMIRLSLEAVPYIKINTIEKDLPQPSYTITTLEALKKKFPKNKFVLIMGEDNLSTLHKWKDYEVLLTDYQIYVFPRFGAEPHTYGEHKNVKILANTPKIEISSTFIRNSVKDKKTIAYMMNIEAFKYLELMNFYK